MTDWEYRWENAIYDTQRWEFKRWRGNHSQSLGIVQRVIRARQSYDDRVHEYKAFAFTIKQNQTFNTRVEAEAWVTACERME